MKPYLIWLAVTGVPVALFIVAVNIVDRRRRARMSAIDRKHEDQRITHDIHEW